MRYLLSVLLCVFAARPCVADRLLPQILSNPTAKNGDTFGNSVAISGDTMVVGSSASVGRCLLASSIFRFARGPINDSSLNGRGLLAHAARMFACNSSRGASLFN
ncbi:MAG: FG-GAP repeat protein [Phycisphaerales bacterium]